MSTQKPFTYQPEDLERLLRTKEFNGLLPEERAFVLQHVSNEKEFNELKMLLGNIESSKHEMQDPPAAVWKNLKKEFNAHKPSRFKVWLNFLFPPLPKWSGFRTVSFSLVGMATVVGAVVWFVPNDNKPNTIADSNIPSARDTTSESKGSNATQNGEFKVNPEQYAELKPVSGIYVTPVVREVEHVYEAPLNDEVSEENSIAPANDDVEEKSNRRMENDAPTVTATENSNDLPTLNFTTDGNLSAPAVQWTTGTIETTTIVTDSVKIQPKKKKKTVPKKK
jgi:hypothetical protein